MTTLHLIKTASGAFVPATEDDQQAAKRFRVGEVSRMELRAMRNGGYFRKWWALVKVAFDAWAETLPAQEYHGKAVLPDFDRFRRDLTIMAGFARPVWVVGRKNRVTPEMVTAAISAATGYWAKLLRFESVSLRGAMQAGIAAALKVDALHELRLEAESLAWSQMTEERFEQLYSATINAILHKILPGRGLTEAGLREWATRVLEFA
jgi:hypothetical protein